MQIRTLIDKSTSRFCSFVSLLKKKKVTKSEVKTKIVQEAFLLTHSPNPPSTLGWHKTLSAYYKFIEPDCGSLDINRPTAQQNKRYKNKEKNFGESVKSGSEAKVRGFESKCITV